MVLAPLVILFIAVPILELFILLQVGEAIGVLPTIGLLIADSILGSVLMRSQGRIAWQRFNAALAEGRPPTKEVADGALIVFGGAMLLTPGFFSDVFGILFLLPPTRALLRKVIVKRLTARVVASARAGGPQAGPMFFSFGGRPPGADPRYDVEGDAHEVHPPKRELP